MTRSTSTRRSQILDALVEKFKAINGTGDYRTQLSNQVFPTMKFWDEISTYPAVHLSAGTETREYYGSNSRWRFLTITIRAYVNQEDPVEALCLLLEDLEYVLDNNLSISYSDSYGSGGTAQQTILSIDTDEGVLAPLGIGEMIIEVRY
tara:strand:+ start:26 stop:472 length:447 start_codon:yes stop_codon:yes gene_type:complete